MHIVAIAWMYVALMMAVVEAFSAQGSLLGGLITFALYGLLPLAVVLYIGGASARRRARHQRELAERSALADPGGGGHAAAAPVAPVREEP